MLPTLPGTCRDGERGLAHGQRHAADPGNVTGVTGEVVDQYDLLLGGFGIYHLVRQR